MTDRYLRRNEVERSAGLARSTIYRRIAEGTFPSPYALGPNCVRWRESELVEWKNGHQKSLGGCNDVA